MSDIHAAIGQVQMSRLDGLVRRRRELASRYREALADHPYVRPPHIPDYAEPNYQSYMVSLTDDAPLGRDELIRYLHERHVMASPGIMLAHRYEAHRGRAGADRLSNSEKAHNRSLLLPLYPQLPEPLQDQVVKALRQAFSLMPRSKRHG
jgi:perosamine synthetase